CHNDYQTNSFKFCKICGVKFSVSPSNLKRFSTCNKKECRSSNKRRENNPNWRGGIGNKKKAWDSTKKAKDWKANVFKRDDYTCKICGQRGGDLEAHHKKPWAFFPKLRCSISNGITLCLNCHKKTFKGIKFWRMIVVLEGIQNGKFC